MRSGEDRSCLPLQAAVTVHPFQSLAHVPDGLRQLPQGSVQGLLIELRDGTDGLDGCLREEGRAQSVEEPGMFVYGDAGHPLPRGTPRGCAPAGAFRASKELRARWYPTLIPGTAAFSTRRVTRMKPRRLSPPGSEMMVSRFLQG